MFCAGYVAVHITLVAQLLLAALMIGICIRSGSLKQQLPLLGIGVELNVNKPLFAV